VLYVLNSACSSSTRSLISNANSIFFFSRNLIFLDHADNLVIRQPGSPQCGDINHGTR
jgi:hypothetical protein